MTEYRAEQENEREYNNYEPKQATIDRLRETIDSQALEILRLQECIRSLETEHVSLYVPDEQGHELFDGLPRAW